MVFLLPLTQLWKQDRIILIIRLAGKMQVEITRDLQNKFTSITAMAAIVVMPGMPA